VDDAGQRRITDHRIAEHDVQVYRVGDAIELATREEQGTIGSMSHQDWYVGAIYARQASIGGQDCRQLPLHWATGNRNLGEQNK
jgi:hypothetical protein